MKLKDILEKLTRPDREELVTKTTAETTKAAIDFAFYSAMIKCATEEPVDVPAVIEYLDLLKQLQQDALETFMELTDPMFTT